MQTCCHPPSQKNCPVQGNQPRGSGGLLLPLPASYWFCHVCNVRHQTQYSLHCQYSLLFHLLPWNATHPSSQALVMISQRHCAVWNCLLSGWWFAPGLSVRWAQVGSHDPPNVYIGLWVMGISVAFSLSGPYTVRQVQMTVSMDSPIPTMLWTLTHVTLSLGPYSSLPEALSLGA